MARPAKLIPHYDKTRGQWVLNVPAGLSADGKRQRIYWDRGKEADALEHARRLRDGRTHFKARARLIRTDLMEDAVKWDDTAKEWGFHGLAHFCATKFKEMEAVSASPAFSVLLDAFVADHRKNWSDQYFGKRWKPFRKRLSEVETLRVSQLDEAYWREWLKGWKAADKPSPETYNQQLGMIRSLFELSAARKVHPHNPLADLPGAKDRRRVVPVSSPAEVLTLLETAWEHDRDMVPYFAVCYFAGLRPDSEARRLKFQHIDWKAGHVLVDVTKTDANPRRFVDIEDALRTWLQPWMRKKGLIVPDNFAKRRRRLIYGYYTTPGATLADEAKWKQLVPWGHDITRHTYGSMWEAGHRGQAGSREKIVANLGHANIKTFERYYRNARSEGEAAAFWSIAPPSQRGNIVAIA